MVPEGRPPARPLANSHTVLPALLREPSRSRCPPQRERRCEAFSQRHGPRYLHLACPASAPRRARPGGLCAMGFSKGAIRSRLQAHARFPARLPDHPVAAVADSLEFEHKYTSGVIAWSPENAPSDAQIDRVVDEFEKTALGGAGTGPLRLVGYRAPRSGQWGPVCSPSLAAATVYVELRGTMRNTKTRDRTRGRPLSGRSS